MSENRKVLLSAINAIKKADKYFDTSAWFKDKNFIQDCETFIKK